MGAPISRRTVLAAGAAAAGLSLTGTAAQAAGRPEDSVGFTLRATVLDGGEQVTSIALSTADLGPIDAASLTTGTFSVHAKGTSPVPVPAGEKIVSEYDLDRRVTAVRLIRHGNIAIDLAHGEGQVGAGTLGYLVQQDRNVRLDLDYTITQNRPFSLTDGRSVTIAAFVQGQLTSSEVDLFDHGVSAAGMKYRLYSPLEHSSQVASGGRPLVLWLHGSGEGALLSEDYYDNETTLRANRGALGFATAKAQEIFQGAYVVVPQSTSYWVEDGAGFATQIREILDDVVGDNRVDPDRIYVAGCSNGGYMTMKLTSAYPDFFAAAVPVCGMLEPETAGGPRLLTDTQLAQIDTPTWLVASRDDPAIPPQANTVHAHDLIPGSLLTMYDHVIWAGTQFNGHFSWIYVAHDDPSVDGTNVWEWMAQQER